MRQGMWEKVASRSHKPTKIFAGSDSHEVMLFGTVDYELKDGKKATDIEWAARAHFSPLGGAPKMDEYQVYLVSLPLKFCLKYGPLLTGSRRIPLPWLPRLSRYELQRAMPSTACSWHSHIAFDPSARTHNERLFAYRAYTGTHLFCCLS